MTENDKEQPAEMLLRHDVQVNGRAPPNQTPTPKHQLNTPTLGAPTETKFDLPFVLVPRELPPATAAAHVAEQRHKVGFLTIWRAAWSGEGGGGYGDGCRSSLMLVSSAR